MDVIASLGRDVLETVGQTYETYGNILRLPANSSVIHKTEVTSFSYGQHPRNVLDLYEPEPTTPPPLAGRTRPILLYVYGGAFMFGDRILSDIPGELVYRNIASFFAGKLGYNVIIMDYRLVKQGAKYPSGGEDVDEAIGWICRHFTEEHDLFLMGHSAGGSHIATWMFAEDFQDRRNVLISGTKGPKLAGAIFLSTPLSLTPDLEALFEPYYGKANESRMKQPTSLMHGMLRQTNPSLVEKWPRILVLVSELDPESVHDAATGFKKPWSDAGGRLELKVLERHNHHSPPLSLGTQIEEEEAWGYLVGEWMKTASSDNDRRTSL